MTAATRWARRYFAVQSVGGAAWWVGVSTLPWVRDATLGGLDPVAVAVFDVPLFVVGSALAAAGLRPAAVIATVWTCVVAVALAGYATVTATAGWGVVVMVLAAGGSALALSQLVLGRVPTEFVIVGPFAPRVARPRSRGAHVATTLGQIAVFWGWFLVVLPLGIRMLERRWQLDVPWPPVLVAVGVAVLVLASALGLWAASAMATHGNGTPLPAATASHLVVRGPYRFVRNPMAVAGIAQGVAVGLIGGSWLVIGYALVGSVLWNLAVRPHEEADLEARFGDEFRRYRDEVRCWVPRSHPVPATVASAE